MEIRFCDRCSESIPDVDFDAGKAVSVSGRHYHASCALAKSLAIAGPRSWLTFVLALLGAGAAVFLLVSRLGREEPPAVTTAVRAAISDSAQGVEARLADRIDRGLEHGGKVAGEAARSAADAVRGDLGAQLDQLKGRLEEEQRGDADHLAGQRRRLDEMEKQMAAVEALLREVREQADRLEAQRVAAVPPPPPTEPPPEPVTPPTPGTTPTPEPGTPPPSTAPSAEVDRWIARLKDPNENIRFTATLQLGLLKDLRATQPLIEVLQKDRDYYVRLGAATALGDVQAVDAIPALIEALEDDDGLVRTAANDALRAITDQPFEFVPGMSRSERRKLQRRWKDWYDQNEAALRTRYGQPKAS